MYSRKNGVFYCIVKIVFHYGFERQGNKVRSYKEMTKRDLVVKISADTNLTQKDVSTVVQKTLDYIAEELVAGNTIELRNFGVFEVKIRKSRKGRNPNKPEITVTIPERAVVKFRAGKELRERIVKKTGC